MNKSGFSMIEVMVAAGILAILLSTTVSALGSAIHQSNHQRQMTQAILVSEGVMEELFLPYKTGNDLTPGSHTRLFGKNGEQVGSNETYTVQWTVSLDNPYPRIIRIDLKITWQENGITRSASFVNFKT